MKAKDSGVRVPTTVGTTTVADLHGRCSVVEPGVVLLREVANATAETCDVLIEHSLALGQAFDPFVLVIDLSEVTERPKNRYLEIIRRRLLDGRAYLAVTQPRTAFLRTVVRYMLATKRARSSLHSSVDEAIEAARARLGHAAPSC
jgi:hypothetical protein